jgi:hypothetical protein
MSKLAELRAALLEAEQTKSGSKGASFDNAIYPHWNIDSGTSTTLRFLPDADPENVFFWKERQMIRLPFSGIKGQDERKEVIVQVPCMEMWEPIGSCPVLRDIRPMYKANTNLDTAKKYWKKKSFLYQGFVTETTMVEEGEGISRNSIRRFIVSPSIQKIIETALMSPDYDELPCHYDQGVDFRIIKTQKGEYADYSTSSYARKERSLNQEERDAIADHGLFDLKEFMPKKPTPEEVSIIEEMFHASFDGELYDPERWGAYFRPSGMQFEGATKTEITAQSVPNTDTTDDIPFEPDAKAEPKVKETVSASGAETGQKSAADILAAIRNR